MKKIFYAIITVSLIGIIFILIFMKNSNETYFGFNICKSDSSNSQMTLKEARTIISNTFSDDEGIIKTNVYCYAGQWIFSGQQIDNCGIDDRRIYTVDIDTKIAKETESYCTGASEPY